MKKIIAVLLCLVFCLSFASCGDNNDTTSKKTSASCSSSAAEKTTSATKAAEKSKNLSKAKEIKKKKSSKTSSKASKKTSSKTSSKSKSKSSSSSSKISRLERLICNLRGWKTKNNSNQTVVVKFLSGGAAKVQVFNRKGVLVHNKMEYGVWSVSGDTLTMNNSTSEIEDGKDKYRFKEISDSVLDKAPPDKSNEKYLNYIPLDSTGLKKNEFYVSKKYFCFYMGSDGGKGYCKLYKAK